MKKLKCLLGHNIHIMKLHELTKHTYDNAEENITVYKCKYCDKIVFQRTNFVKAEFKDPKEIDKDKTKEDIKVREYQGWSLNNTKNILNLYGNDIGYIHLVSDKDINAIEKLGLLKVIKNSFNIYKSYDIYADVYESEYNKDDDYICGKYRHYGVSVDKASEHFSKYCGFKLEDAETIITIKYSTVRRFHNSKWWRFKNRRKCIINNEMNIE